METFQNKQQSYKLDYHGTGGEYFSIFIVNLLLTIITLGIYYPWAKERKLKYFYGATSLNNDRFTFSGTGKEMFLGFIKVFAMFVVVILLLCVPFLGLLLYLVFIFTILPLAIHGSLRYRLSRSSWRGIRFGYRGDKWEYTKMFIIQMLLTLITLGIYGPWAQVKLTKYMMKNIKVGDAEFKYEGEGSELFMILLKGFLLSIITLGIYLFWLDKDLFNYNMNKISLNKDEEKIQFSANATGFEFLCLELLNMIQLVFTLGLGYPWVITRTMKFVTQKIELNGNIDLDSLNQTEEEYNNAFGDSALDFFDFDFII